MHHVIVFYKNAFSVWMEKLIVFPQHIFFNLKVMQFYISVSFECLKIAVSFQNANQTDNQH